MKVRVVGVECATDDAKVEWAAGAFDGQRLRVEKATLCVQDQTAATTIICWLEEGPNPVLQETAPIAERRKIVQLQDESNSTRLARAWNRTLMFLTPSSACSPLKTSFKARRSPHGSGPSRA